MIDIKNVTIREAYIGGWDRIVPTSALVVSLSFEGDGWVQGSGSYPLRSFDYLRMLLVTLELAAWDSLVGTHCRVKRENGHIVAVGHLIKDQWFTFNA